VRSSGSWTNATAKTRTVTYGRARNSMRASAAVALARDTARASTWEQRMCTNTTLRPQNGNVGALAPEIVRERAEVRARLQDVPDPIRRPIDRDVGFPIPIEVTCDRQIGALAPEIEIGRAHV